MPEGYRIASWFSLIFVILQITTNHRRDNFNLVNGQLVFNLFDLQGISLFLSLLQLVKQLCPLLEKDNELLFGKVSDA